VSNKKSKAVRKERRQRGSDKSPGLQEGLGSRLKAIALRALLFAVFLTISGYGMSILWNRNHPPKPLHPFTPSERASFVDRLKAGGKPTRSVWLACPVGKTETCQLVKQFVPMFEISGRRRESGEVIQWSPANPLSGVYLISHAVGEGEPDPPEASAITSSLTAIGIPTQSAAAPDVPQNSVGVFFNPEL